MSTATLGNCASSRLRLLDCPIDNATFAETLDVIEGFVRSGVPHHQVSVNVDKVLKVRSDPEFRRIVEEADLVSVDGLPIVWAGRLLGHPIKERVAGIDLMQAVVGRGAERGWRVYFLGATAEVLKKAIEELKRAHPRLQVAGSRHGYWSSEAEEARIVEDIRRAKADVLFIGISSPKKELFAYRHGPRMGVPFVMGVGGSFDVIAGVTRRAPTWMQQVGLEWFWRFLQEPRRMWRRYFVDDMKFVLLVARQMLRRHPTAS